MIKIEPILNYLLALQGEITEALCHLDSTAIMQEDKWKRAEGGGGCTRIVRNGGVFEQAGINFSHVCGNELPTSATLNRPELAGRKFQALGVSSVTHPINPFVPTAHMNVRFFIAEKDHGDAVWWFGGGLDLTPYYGFVADAKHWHTTAKKACAEYGEDVYPRYKKWCDDYFYLRHRQEPRGIGGIFFDDLNEWGFDKCFAFLCCIGDAFLPAYMPIVKRRKDREYGEKQRQFQLYRRGRYVEFNLLYDRGTLFGLQSGGRTESILMSLPPLARWQYDWQPELGALEAELYNKYLHPREWA